MYRNGMLSEGWGYQMLLVLVGGRMGKAEAR